MEFLWRDDQLPRFRFRVGSRQTNARQQQIRRGGGGASESRRREGGEVRVDLSARRSGGKLLGGVDAQLGSFAVQPQQAIRPVVILLQRGMTGGKFRRRFPPGNVRDL